MSSTILITAFEPFLHYPVNSSEQVARAIGDRSISNIHVEILPVDHVAAAAAITTLLTDLKPATCLALGMAATESAFRIERFGRKCPGLAHFDGVDELEGAWDWDDLTQHLAQSGRPVRLSDDAGRYVCDTTYWTLLDHRRRHGLVHRAAFLHLPALSEEFPVSLMADAVIRAAQSTNIASP